MANSLLIGNGFNRCLSGGIPWGDLLSKIAADYHVSYHEKIPMPLEFERIVNEYQQRNVSLVTDVHNQTKEKIATLIKAPLPPSIIHTALSKLNPDNIITTNYDLFIEYAYDPSFVPKINKGPSGTRYVEKKVGRIGTIDFYHAHGCVDVPETICLGYEHYMGIVSKAKNGISTKRKPTNKIAICQKLTGVEPFECTWAELFFTSDIDIMGLALDVNESDLWWLLTYRASLYYNDIDGIKTNLTNRIVFHEVIDDVEKNDPQKEAERQESECNKREKQQLLKGVHVEVKEYPLSQYHTYEDAYLAMLSPKTH